MNLRLILMFFWLLLFSEIAFSERLRADQFSLKIEGVNVNYSVGEEITFQIVVEAITEGEIITWGTTSVAIELSSIGSMEEKNIQEESIITFRVGQTIDDAIFTTGVESVPSSIFIDGGMSVELYPPSEFVTISPSSPYIKNIVFSQDLYLDDNGENDLLAPSAYELKVTYLHVAEEDIPGWNELEEDEQYMEAKTYFTLSAQGEEEVAIEHWLGIVSDTASHSGHVRSALGLVEDFTGQILYTRDLQLDVNERSNAVNEYRGWWQRSKDIVELVVDDDGIERLVDPNDRSCISCYDGPKLIGYGETMIGDVSASTINLSGNVSIAYAGLRSIKVTNHRLPDADITVQRTNYTEWQSDIPVLSGVNNIVVEAEDYTRNKSSVTFVVTRN